jgi:hypothetical protein
MFTRAKDLFPFHCAILVVKNLMHISKLCLQVALGHQIGWPYEGEVHSYHAPNLMDHLFLKWQYNVVCLKARMESFKVATYKQAPLF